MKYPIDKNQDGKLKLNDELLQGEFLRDPVGAYGRRPLGPYTIEEYYAIPEDRRVELIDGYIYDMASVSKVHQRILLAAAYQIQSCIESLRKECELYVAPSDVQLDEDIYTMVQPDIFVVCGPDDPKEHAHQGAPELIVEILSPSNRMHDKVRKLLKYRKAGVREYWIIDPENREVLVYLFAERDEPERYSFEDIIPIGISEGHCKVDFAAISRSIARFY